MLLVNYKFYTNIIFNCELVSAQGIDLETHMLHINANENMFYNSMLNTENYNLKQIQLSSTE